MKIVKNHIFEIKEYYTKNKFIVNDIMPIAVKNTTYKQDFIFLFIAKQDYDDAYIFIQTVFHAEDQFELDALNEHRLNLENMKKQKTKDFESYKILIQNLTGDNLYNSDFDLQEDKEHPFYFHCIGTRNIELNQYLKNELYFPREQFIRLKLYLNQMTKNPTLNNEYIFINKALTNIEFVEIDKIQLDATCQDKNENYFYIFCNISHYTLWCGPSKFSFNFATLIDENIKRNLLIPLDKNIYNATYGKEQFLYNIIIQNIGEEEYLYLLYEDEKDKKFKVLKVSPKLYRKTNFVDHNNYIYEKE